MLDRIEFLFGEGITAFRRNGWMTFAAISTAAVALFVIAGLGYAYFGIRDFMGSLGGRFTMRAYLRDGTDYQGITDTAKKIRAIPGVEQVVWIPKEKAWEQKKRELPDITSGLVNPFPDGYKINLKKLDDAPTIIKQIEAIPTIDKEEGVLYMGDYLNFLDQGMWFIRVLGLPFAGLCLFTAGLLIYNAIRLTILARRREIRIMQLVGASYATIRIPFLLEGALQGAFGGLLATVFLYAAHIGLNRLLQDKSALGSLGSFPLYSVTVIMVLAGISYGAGCSGFAVRSPLKLGASQG